MVVGAQWDQSLAAAHCHHHIAHVSQSLYFLIFYLTSLNTLVHRYLEYMQHSYGVKPYASRIMSRRTLVCLVGTPVDGLCPSSLTFCYLVAPAEAHDHKVAKGDGHCSLMVAGQEVGLLGHSKPFNLVFIEANTHLCISLSHIICNQLK